MSNSINYQAVPESIKEIIEDMLASGDCLHAPSYQVDKKTFTKLGSILKTRFRGSWNSKYQAFVFPICAQSVKDIVRVYGMPPKNQYDFFASPSNVSSLMMDLLDIPDRLRYLDAGDYTPNFFEPNIGNGALISKVLEHTPEGVELEFRGCEIDPVNRASCASLPVDIVGDDFLAYETEERFSFVVMNPPFTSPGMPNAWHNHLMHATKLLKRGGRLGCVIPTGWFDKAVAFSALSPAMKRIYDDIASLPGLYIEQNSAGAFKESGTMVDTCILTVDCCAGERDYENLLDIMLCNADDELARGLIQFYREAKLSPSMSEFLYGYLLTKCMQELNFIPTHAVKAFLELATDESNTISVDDLRLTIKLDDGHKPKMGDNEHDAEALEENACRIASILSQIEEVFSKTSKSTSNPVEVDILAYKKGETYDLFGSEAA